MGASLSKAQPSDPVRSLDNLRPTPVKAGLRSDQIGLSFGASMKDAILAHYGSVKEAAYALGQVDPSLMMREFGESKFARFDQHADELAKASVCGRLLDVFGPLTTPFARGEKLLSDIENDVRELRQLLLSVMERTA